MLTFLMGFEIIDVSGDVGLRASGSTIGEAFESTALGMYSLVTDTSLLNVDSTIRVEASGDSHERLLVTWLNELVFLLDTQGFVGKEVRVGMIGEDRLVSEIKGEEFDTERHPSGLLIKAATYHNLRIVRSDDGWTVEIIFDI